MITYLEGTLAGISGAVATVDVGGVGYLVRVGIETAAALSPREGERVRVLTHLVVRENAHELYGFLEREDLEFFDLLIGISGIGPKTALGILNVADTATLRQAVHSGESSYLTKVSGVGKKNAEKIILELKDKIGAEDGDSTAAYAREELDALDALKALGYSTKEARDALRAVPKDVSQTNERLKEALKLLAKT